MRLRLMVLTPWVLTPWRSWGSALGSVFPPGGGLQPLLQGTSQPHSVLPRSGSLQAGKRPAPARSSLRSEWLPRCHQASRRLGRPSGFWDRGGRRTEAQAGAGGGGRQVSSSRCGELLALSAPICGSRHPAALRAPSCGWARSRGPRAQPTSGRNLLGPAAGWLAAGVGVGRLFGSGDRTWRTRPPARQPQEMRPWQGVAGGHGPGTQRSPRRSGRGTRASAGASPRALNQKLQALGIAGALWL